MAEFTEEMRNLIIQNATILEEYSKKISVVDQQQQELGKQIAEIKIQTGEHNRRIGALEEDKILMYQIDKNVAVLVERTKNDSSKLESMSQDIMKLKKDQIRSQEDIETVQGTTKENNKDIKDFSSISSKLVYEVIKYIVIAGVAVLCTQMFEG